MYSNIRAIVFDLDNVLIDEAGYYMAVFREGASELSRECGIEEKALLQKMAEAFDCRGASKTGVFADILRGIGIYTKAGDDRLFDIFCSLACRLNPYPDALSILAWLEDRGCKTGLVTNGTVAAQKNKLHVYGLANSFDSVVIARELGRDFEKPHPAPFLAVLRQLGAAGREAVYVGDNPPVDFPGAISAGMNTVRINRGEFRGKMIGAGYGAGMVIEDLNEIRRLFETGVERETTY